MSDKGSEDNSVERQKVLASGSVPCGIRLVGGEAQTFLGAIVVSGTTQVPVEDHAMSPGLLRSANARN